MFLLINATPKADQKAPLKGEDLCGVFQDIPQATNAAVDLFQNNPDLITTIDVYEVHMDVTTPGQYVVTMTAAEFLDAA